MKRNRQYGWWLLILLWPVLSMGQSDSSQSRWQWQFYAEGYFSYDFHQPQNNARPFFLYNFDIHQEPHFNLAMGKVAYAGNRFRANLALGTGTYMYANYAPEPDWAKNVFEANAGFRLSKQRDLWLDAGVLPSHIGFESAIGKDNPTLTRSLCAESTPYFETGVRLGYNSPNTKWQLAALYLNGWQHIRRPAGNTSPAFGWQVAYKPNEAVTINSSSFIGNDKPDTARRMRYFHNIYGIFKWGERLTAYAGLDVGWEEATPHGSELNNWLNATAILRWQANKWLALALRGEYYDDPAGVIISTGTPNGMQTFGWSANADVQVGRHLLWRTEFRSFNSQDAIFVKGSGYATGNNAITTSLAVWF